MYIHSKFAVCNNISVRGGLVHPWREEEAQLRVGRDLQILVNLCLECNYVFTSVTAMSMLLPTLNICFGGLFPSNPNRIWSSRQIQISDTVLYYTNCMSYLVSFTILLRLVQSLLVLRELPSDLGHNGVQFTVLGVVVVEVFFVLPTLLHGQYRSVVAETPIFLMTHLRHPQD